MVKGSVGFVSGSWDSEREAVRSAAMAWARGRMVDNPLLVLVAGMVVFERMVDC